MLEKICHLFARYHHGSQIHTSVDIKYGSGDIVRLLWGRRACRRFRWGRCTCALHPTIFRHEVPPPENIAPPPKRSTEPRPYMEVIHCIVAAECCRRKRRVGESRMSRIKVRLSSRGALLTCRCRGLDVKAANLYNYRQKSHEDSSRKLFMT